MEGSQAEQTAAVTPAGGGSAHPELDRARRASLRAQHMHLHQEGKAAAPHKGGASTDAFHRHRADSLLKMLGRKPGDADPDAEQKLHHLVRCVPPVCCVLATWSTPQADRCSPLTLVTVCRAPRKTARSSSRCPCAS